MLRETIVHKWDIVTIHSRPLYTILAIAFIGLLVATNGITSFVVPLSVKGFLVYRRLGKFYTAISSVIEKIYYSIIFNIVRYLQKHSPYH